VMGWIAVDRGGEAGISCLGWETSEELPSEKRRGAATASNWVAVVCPAEITHNEIKAVLEILAITYVCVIISPAGLLLFNSTVQKGLIGREQPN